MEVRIFRPLLYSDGAHFNFFVRDWLFLPTKSDLFIKGKAKNELFGTRAYKSRCLVYRIDFAGNNFRSSLRSVFAPPLMAIVWLARQVYPEVLMVIQIVTHRRLYWSLRFLAEFLFRLLLVFDIYFGYS